MVKWFTDLVGMSMHEDFLVTNECLQKSTPIRVLHFCETAMGGVGIYQRHLRAMSSIDYDQIFVMPEQHSSIMGDKTDVITFSRKSRSFLGIFSQAAVIRKQVKVFQPDIIFFHSSFALPLLFFFSILKGRQKLVYCSHGWAAEQYPPGILRSTVRKLEGWLCGFSNLNINISDSELDFAMKNGYSGTHVVIENAVPPSLFKNANPRESFSSEVNLLFVGRFDKQKGLDILLDAFSAARTKRKDLKLTVIGAAVRGEANPPEMDGVRFVGWIDGEDIDEWYAAADALVVPSRWEGFGLVIPEALRNGTPSLVAQRSGMQNRIQEGVTGFSFPLDVQNLADLLASLDVELLRSMRNDCIDLYRKRFAMDRLFEDLDSVYKNLTTDAASPSLGSGLR